MNAPTKIVAALDAETYAMVERLAGAQGRSAADFAAEAIRRVAETETDYDAFLQAGVDSLDRGEGVPHEEVMAKIDAMIASRRSKWQN